MSEEVRRAHDEFLELVRNSIQERAESKGYTDQKYKLEFVSGIQPAHSIGEIERKIGDYWETGNRTNLIKIAGYCALLYKYGSHVKRNPPANS